MNKALPLCLTFTFFAALAQAKTPSKPADFSGNWVLDTSKTKNLPEGLEAYSIVVNQDAQQLKVQALLQGNLRPREGPRGTYPGGTQGPVLPGSHPGRGVGGMGLPGAGMGLPGGGMGVPIGGGMPGGGGDQSRAENRSQATIAAFTFYPRNATYNLDGSESSAQLGDPSHNDATLKADWAKNGEVLKLSLVGTGNSVLKGSKIQMKDQWKLSKDGQLLMVERAVRSPGGSVTLHLVFRKQDAGSKNSAGQAHTN